MLFCIENCCYKLYANTAAHTLYRQQDEKCIGRKNRERNKRNEIEFKRSAGTLQTHLYPIKVIVSRVYNADTHTAHTHLYVSVRVCENGHGQRLWLWKSNRRLYLYAYANGITLKIRIQKSGARETSNNDDLLVQIPQCMICRYGVLQQTMLANNQSKGKMQCEK